RSSCLIRASPSKILAVCAAATPCRSVSFEIAFRANYAIIEERSRGIARGSAFRARWHGRRTRNAERRDRAGDESGAVYGAPAAAGRQRHPQVVRQTGGAVPRRLRAGRVRAVRLEYVPDASRPWSGLPGAPPQVAA